MTAYFARLLAERLAGMPQATCSVFVTLVCAGHRRLLDEQRPDLRPEQRDADNAAFTTSLADALDAMTIFLISPHPWPFLRNHPKVRSFATLEEAVRCIVAMQAGERSRETMEKGQAPGGCRVMNAR